MVEMGFSGNELVDGTGGGEILVAGEEIKGLFENAQDIMEFYVQTLQLRIPPLWVIQHGFEFDEYPGSCMFAPIYPLLEFELFPEFVDKIKGYASMAIRQCFGDDGKRNVTEIVKINAGGCRDFTYYITFKIDNEGSEETFQAKVECTIEKTIEIPICRRKVVY